MYLGEASDDLPRLRGYSAFPICRIMSENIEPTSDKRPKVTEGYESHTGEKDYQTGPAVDIIGEGEELQLKQ